MPRSQGFLQSNINDIFIVFVIYFFGGRIVEKKTDLRIIKTHMALHKAFTELLSQKPFELISTNELCDAAMIRRTTFYKHFTDKYDYFNFYLSELMNESKKIVPLDKLEENILEYAERRLYEHLEFMRQHPKITYHCKNSNLVSFFLQSVHLQFETELRYILIDIKQYPSTPQLDFTISLYAGGLISAISWWLENPDTLSDSEIAKLLVETITYPNQPI